MSRIRDFVMTAAPWAAPDASQLADDAWIVLVPTHYNDAETLDTLGLAPSPTGDAFARQVYTLDRKVLCGDDVRFGHTNPHVSEAFVRALEAAGVRGWSATPLPHASPNAVRGEALYLVDALGAHLTLDASAGDDTPRFAPKTVGRAGFPAHPVVFDGASWTGDAAGLTEPFASYFNRPWRGLAVRGDFVKTFERLHGRRLRCAFEPAAMVNAPATPRATLPSTRTHATAPWTAGPTPSALIARIVAHAARYDHHLPPPAPSLDALDRVAAAHQSAWPEALRCLLSQWNGASLHGGAIGFLALTAREGERELAGRHAHFGVPDDLEAAQLRSGGAEWSLARPEGAMLFGWRCEESPAIWCVDRAGLVRLLEQGGAALGPAIPATAWLHDQLEDLAYAADSGAWPASKWLGE
jgi:hypothetical protein